MQQCGSVRTGQKEDHEGDQRTEAPLLQKWAERPGDVQPREEKSSGRFRCGIQYLKGAYKKTESNFLHGYILLTQSKRVLI